MKKTIILLIAFVLCTNFVYSQTTIESYFGMSITEIENHFIDSTFQKGEIFDDTKMEVLSTQEGQSIKFFFDKNQKCNGVVYATNIHEIVQSIIDDNDLRCGESTYVKDTSSSSIQWVCKENILITLKVYTESAYPFQFTYSIK